MTTGNTCVGEFRIVCANCGVLPERPHDWVAASLLADKHSDTCGETDWFHPDDTEFERAAALERSPDRALRFRSTGEGYEYVSDRTPHDEGGERPVYIHRLNAVAWGLLDGLDDPRHVHHRTSIPWLNTEDNLEAIDPSDHARVTRGTA